MIEIEYWENYYKSRKDTHYPSLFAKFVLKNYVKRNSSLIEFGCGNGRDAKYFANNHINIIAFDQCEKEILRLLNKNINNN